MRAERIQELISVYRSALLDDVVPFWSRHAIDRDAGGFLHCLDRDGSVFCTDKNAAMQARMVWLYARLYNEIEAREDWLEHSSQGADFLLRHGFAANGLMYHEVSREGQPLGRASDLDGMGFAVMGFAELARARQDSQLGDSASSLYDRLLRALRRIEARPFPRKVNRDLGRRLVLLQLTPGLQRVDSRSQLAAEQDRGMRELLGHFVRPEAKLVLDRLDRRLRPRGLPQSWRMCPGHALEVAWFLLDEARSRGDGELAARALPLLDWALDRGWDELHGGLYLQVDASGRARGPQGERKVWWPQYEAQCACLFAHALTGDARWEAWFERIHAYAFERFRDPEHGECFAYLERDGRPVAGLARSRDGSRPRGAAKGDLQKSGFHVMRCLLVCWRLLQTLQRGAGARGPVLR